MGDSFQSVLKAQNLGFCQGVLPATRTVRVAFILLEQFSLTSFSAALDALSTGATLEQGAQYPVSFWSPTGGMVHSDVGVQVDTQRLALGGLQHQVIVLVGGHRVRLAPDAWLTKLLRRAAVERAVFCGLWNGAFHLAQAGLLDGHACVCHPDSRAPIREYHPTLNLSGSGYALDNRVGTSAEPGAVLELMLAVMKVCAQGQVLAGADEIQRLHQPERCLQATSAEQRAHGKRVSKLLGEALALMEQHMEEPLDIEQIADQVGVSRRQLERRFSRYLNAPPVRYYLELRLTRARQLIVHSNRSLTDVALATGFVSYPHFHRRFKGLFGLPPMEFRDTYDPHVHHPPVLHAVAMN